MLGSRASVFPKTLKPSLVMRKNILFLDRNKQQWHLSNVIDMAYILNMLIKCLRNCQIVSQIILSVYFVNDDISDDFL